MTKKGKMTKISIALVTALVIVLGMMSTLLAACGKASIALDKTEAALYVGDTLKLTATVSGDDDAEVEWSTSDTKIATVRRGTVNAVGKGSAVITAALENGASATCTLTVSERTVTISQTTATINLDEGNMLTLTATASDNGAISWSTSDPSVAEVADGVVTAYDIGEVTITAQRGAATANCVITVTEPSRPADYYKITKLTNAEVVADPGVWHYHADGSMGGDYGFESEPLHRNNTATATLNVIPKVANSQFFYFRYQPDQIELEHYYTMKLAVTVSSDASLRLGSRGADNKFAALEEEFTANVEKEVSYVGYRNESEPFSVRINSEVNAEKVTLTVRLISVEAHDGTNLPEYHFHEEGPQISYEEIEKDASSYDLEIKTNSETVANPGKWHYNQGEGSTVTEAKYDNGTITFNFENLAVSGNNQLRYRPNLEAETKIKVEFTVTGNVNAKIVLALCDSKTFASEGWTEKQLAADGTQTLSAEFTLKPTHLIFIQVQATGEAKANANLTFSDVKISKEAKPNTVDVSGTYEVEMKTNAEVIANPGKWAYNKSGNTVVEGNPSYNDGTLNIKLSSVEAGNAGDLQLRFRPEIEAGKQYKISFKVTTSAATSIACAPSKGEGWFSGNISAADGSLDLDCTFTAADDALIYIRVRNSFTEASALEITVSDIVITIL